MWLALSDAREPPRASGLLSALAVVLALAPASLVQARADVGPVAPDNLRCPGEPVPPLPGPGWQVVPVWEWRDVAQVEGTLGSSDGPYAVAVDRKCNI